MARQLVTEHELAKIRRRSISTLQKERWRGNGPPFIRDGRSVYYDLGEFWQWFEENTQKLNNTSEAAPRQRNETLGGAA